MIKNAPTHNIYTPMPNLITTTKPTQIILSRKTNMPILDRIPGGTKDNKGLAKINEDESEEESDEESDAGPKTLILVRDKNETKEEKKLRKQMAKEEKKMKRQVKKEIKDTFKREEKKNLVSISKQQDIEHARVFRSIG